MTPEQLAALKETICDTTQGSRQVVVADTSVSLYATDENCLIYRVKLDPAKRTRDRQIADAWFHAKFNPTTCLALLEEVERLTKEIADYEQTDLVPRSRWEATNADWLEAREQFRELAQKAATEIQRLQAEVQEQPT